jgi:hypothetical protein
MSSSQDREGGIFDDDFPGAEGDALPPAEAETFFDSYSGFWGGILLGALGAALVPVSAWLGGAFVFGGYAMTALVLHGARHWKRALRAGFLTFSAVGALLFLGDTFAPQTTWAVIDFGTAHRAVFLGLVFGPWVVAVAKLVLVGVKSLCGVHFGKFPLLSRLYS